ncbi:DUF427 domain-containing protein [Granulosicoccus sp. 3-233]|uniref:DUF427 domain-containing protein n=1 Tax=Granulosicoccus sp. 3-233 TaxID=3417969 RepID=UPI003D33C79C
MKIRMQERYRVVVPDRYLKTRFLEELVSVRQGNHTLITTDLALQLLEGERQPVTYVPLEEVRGAVLQATDTRYTCRWKGEARYYDVHLPDGAVIPDGAWAYPAAPDELALLRTQVSFDTARFTEEFKKKS